MINWVKYMEEILDAIDEERHTSIVAMDTKTGQIKSCKHFPCAHCAFNEGRSCKETFFKWAKCDSDWIGDEEEKEVAKEDLDLFSQEITVTMNDILTAGSQAIVHIICTENPTLVKYDDELANIIALTAKILFDEKVDKRDKERLMNALKDIDVKKEEK